MENTITITVSEYNDMMKRINWLQCLESVGVDNWEGYDIAHDQMSEIYPEDYQD